MTITLVLGGTRSGKSSIAEALADASSTDQAVTYLATAVVDPSDTEHVARVAAHQARRPGSWATFECRQPAELTDQLRKAPGVVLIDSLGTWLSKYHDFEVDPTELIECLRGRNALTVIVSEEVGQSVHPATELGRRYVDAMGTLNQRVSAVADRVLFVVAGRAIEIPNAGTNPRQGTQ